MIKSMTRNYLKKSKVINFNYIYMHIISKYV